MTRAALRVGNCSGFYGDRQSAAAELVRDGDLDVLTGDWLAELTMLILGKQRARDPLAGFATTFVAQLEEVLGSCLDRGIRIVSNAGGVNPAGCADAVRAVAQRLGLQVSVGVITGDDITAEAAALHPAGQLLDAETGRELDTIDGLQTAHAYLGGHGIAACLRAGADVVVTGRVTDAALVLGPAVWAFDWSVDDWDALAGAVVAGHVIECGAQATGGNFSFFTEIPRMRHVGFPIAELYPDGSSVITKAEGTDGAVTVETVTAQLLYEVAQPAYANPDVVARVDTARLTQQAPDRVLVDGVRGTRPPPYLKVSMAFEAGYRNAMSIVLTGLDVEAKVAVAQEAVWSLIPGGRAAYDDSAVELIGQIAPDPQTPGAGSALLRIAVAGRDRQLVGRTFSSAVIGSALSSVPGFFTTTPPSAATSLARYQPALVPAGAVTHRAEVDGVPLAVAGPSRRATPEEYLAAYVSPDPGGAPERETSPRLGATISVPLGRVCGARSGDKGGNANIGVWARSGRAYDWLAGYLTVGRLRALLPGADQLRIDRYELPNLHAVNFVVHGWLGDGVASSLRFDAQAKGLAEYVRARVVDVPAELLPDDGRSRSGR